MSKNPWAYVVGDKGGAAMSARLSDIPVELPRDQIWIHECRDVPLSFSVEVPHLQAWLVDGMSCGRDVVTVFGIRIFAVWLSEVLNMDVQREHMQVGAVPVCFAAAYGTHNVLVLRDPEYLVVAAPCIGTYTVPEYRGVSR